MAIKLSTHRCTDCSGLLEFNKQLKIFECPYCGKTYEKDIQFERIQIDGVAGTIDIVRSVLLDLSTQNYLSAKKSLSECEKVNHTYVGTLLASMAYYLFESINNKEESRVFSSKAKYYANELRENYPNVDEDETSLYDFFDNPDIYAVLYITFIVLGFSERAAFVANYLDINKLTDVNLNKLLLNFCIKASYFDEAMQIAKNVHFIDKRYTLFQVLKYFPDNGEKLNCIKLLFSNGAFTYKDTSLVEKYIDETTDSEITQLEVLIESCKLKMDIKLGVILDKIFTKTNNIETIERTFEALKAVKLTSEDAESILEYITSEKCQSSKVAICALDVLKETKSLYEMNGDYVVKIFKYTQMNSDDKVELLEYIFNSFRINPKSVDVVSNFILNEYNDAVETRYKAVQTLFKHVDSLTLNTLNFYVFGANHDGAYKPNIIDMIVKLKINSVYFNSITNNYILKTNDNLDVLFNVVSKLSVKDKDISSQSCKRLLVDYDLNNSQVDTLFSQKIQISEDTLDLYLSKAAKKKSYNSYLIKKVLGFYSKVSSVNIMNYLLYANSSDIAKGPIACDLIKNARSINMDVKLPCTFLGSSLECKFIHYYFFASKDIDSTKLVVLQELIKKKVKFSDDLLVDGKKKSFKKYITENKSNIPYNLVEMCEILGVFKLFF